MPKPTEKERVGSWDKKVASASKNVYDPWADEYSCDMLEEYYYGKQWKDQSSEWAQRKYVINLFYPSINISKPSMLFQLPKFRVTPRPTRIDDPMSDVEARAKLQEDTLNTFVQSPSLGFEMETGLAILDAQFRFGIIQVGYTADFMDNPNAGKPILVDDPGSETGKSAMKDGSGADVMEPNVKISNEGLYLKWIPGKNVRISEKSHNRTSSCDWIGYSEWHHVEDVKNNPRYRNTSSLKGVGRVKGEGKPAPGDDETKPGMVKIWFIWDLRSKNRLVFAQGGEKFFLEEPFKFLPLVALKFDERLGEWLPLPPTFNWVHPQNELNDTREMQRIHRKRAVRRYLRRNGAFANEEEWAKLCDGEDMVSAEVTGDPGTAVIPMPDAPLDPAVGRNIPQSTDDFIRISGISGEAQQIADSDTATQANLIAMAGKVREASRRVVVGKFLSEIGRVILLTLREKMALPVWIKRAIDPHSPLAQQEAQEVAHLWKQIMSEELGDIDNDISVDIASMSPIAQEQERSEWLQFLNVITNPTLGAILSSSPTLMRKTAGLFNIHSERDLVEVSKAMQMAARMFAEAQAAKAAGVSGNAAPGPTPSNAEIGGQLAQQLPVEVAQGVQ